MVRCICGHSSPSLRSPATAARLVALAACVGALAFGAAPASARATGPDSSQVIAAQALPSAGFAFPPFALPGQLFLLTGGSAPGYYQWNGTSWAFVAPETLVEVGGVLYAWSTDTGAFVEVQPPVATISSPAGGGSYTVGQVVSTTFSCAESDVGPGLASCDDNAGTNTANGGTGTLDTSTPGSFTYTVVATSLDGLSASASIDYTVVAAAPPCSPGTYSSSGLEPCAAAPVGSFVDGTGATAATPCGIGTTTSSTGSTSATDCHATLASLRAALPILVPDQSTSNQLDTSLAAAQQSAARANWIAAANQVGAFIDKAGAARNSRKLTQATASLLIGLAASIRSAFDAGHNP